MEILRINIAVATDEERRFFSFHEWGILVYEPSTCHALHEIQATDIIPGTQVQICPSACFIPQKCLRVIVTRPLFRIFRSTSAVLKMSRALGDVL